MGYKGTEAPETQGMSFVEKCELLGERMKERKEAQAKGKGKRNKADSNKKELLNNAFVHMNGGDKEAARGGNKNPNNNKKTKFGKYHVGDKVHL
jgi:hypothetical protein